MLHRMPSAIEQQAALNYPRHFALLTIISAALAVGGWHAASPLVTSMVYATLHAVAMAVSVRVRAAALTVILFVALAALLCGGNVLVGFLVLRYSALSSIGDELLLGFVAAGGALGYLLLLRVFWLKSLRWTRVAGITTAVALATVAALAFEVHLGRASGLWLALAWWYALSCGLWCCSWHFRRRVEAI